MKKKMNKISVIIPVHEFNDEVKEYLKNAIESVNQQAEYQKDVKPKTYLVITPEIKNDIAVLDYTSGCTILVNVDDSSYQGQVNYGVSQIDTEFFTVLEFDDILSNTFIVNGLQHIEYYTDVDAFLTMMIEVDDKDNAVKLTNETVWSQQFVGENGEMGYLNANALKQYTDFKLSGALIKKSEFEGIGGYKTNIKLTFMLEFLMRMLNNTCKVYIIPKIGYKHLTTRETSLFNGYFKNMAMSERKFWFETALNESNFTSDREIDMTLMNVGENNK